MAREMTVIHLYMSKEEHRSVKHFAAAAKMPMSRLLKCALTVFAQDRGYDVVFNLKGRPRTLTADGRARIIAAQERRWKHAKQGRKQ